MGFKLLVFCAQDKSRTCTTHSSPPPQSGVSTNFTTWASKTLQRYTFFYYTQHLYNIFFIFLNIFYNILILNKFTYLTKTFPYNFDKIHSTFKSRQKCVHPTKTFFLIITYIHNITHHIKHYNRDFFVTI